MKMVKKYLGDGVYVTKDDLGLYLTTENSSNTIYLEPETVLNLYNFTFNARITEIDETTNLFEWE